MSKRSTLREDLLADIGRMEEAKIAPEAILQVIKLKLGPAASPVQVKAPVAKPVVKRHRRTKAEMAAAKATLVAPLGAAMREIENAAMAKPRSMARATELAEAVAND